jgi:hypothetical protein
MTNRGDVFLLQADGRLIELSERPYDSEDLLQGLLARYPNLLAGREVDPQAPRRWLLVSREVGVPDKAGSAGRWSVDHLFLDQDGIPTLVEVKRSSDTRIRREVVGQMLDYAANCVVYWPAESIQEQLRARCAQTGLEAEQVVAEFLGSAEDVSTFWDRVKTNLQAGRIRMVFVADHIPVELRRIVEFLNAQMELAEVLAVEIRQYVGEDVRTLVPKVFGRTEQALTVKGSGRPQGRRWDEQSFFEDLTARHGPDVASVARTILDWGRSVGLDVWWGRGQSDGSFLLWREATRLWFVSCWTYGRLEIPFDYMRQGPFASLEVRDELRRRLNDIPGINIPENRLVRRPSVELSVLVPGEARRALVSVLSWMLDRTAASPNTTALATDAP